MRGNKESESPTPALSCWEGNASPETPLRADRYLSEVLKLMTRSQLKARGVHFFCNGKSAKLSRKLKAGDHLRLEWSEAPSEEIVPEPIPLTLLYQDDDVFVVDKPQGMVTHPAAGNWRGTLANAVLWLNQAVGADRIALKPDSAAQPPRAGIVHRLDKDTSGVLIVARTATAHEFLSRQFRDREAHKEYVAIVKGAPPAASGRVDTWLARSPRDRKKFAVSPVGRGKHALSLYKVRAIWTLASDTDLRQSHAAAGGASGAASFLARLGSNGKDGRPAYSLLSLYPRTGRTHQLRVHCAFLGCPILGDPLYAKKDARFPDATLMLHARRLRITLPSGAEPAVFKAPVPERFKAIEDALATMGYVRVDNSGEQEVLE